LKSDISDFNKYQSPTRVNPSWMERERAAVAAKAQAQFGNPNKTAAAPQRRRRFQTKP